MTPTWNQRYNLSVNYHQQEFELSDGSGANYLHDAGLNSLSARGFLSFRVTRGLDLNVGASYSRVRDQVYLSGEGLTDEERLLELQQQQTDFQASLNFGFSYQFGSIFNNVVNNRFPGGGGGGGGGRF